MDDRYRHTISKKFWLLPHEINDHYLKEHNLKLKGVIDLTDTLRYYNPELLGCPHFKMRITGGQVPAMQSIEKFYETVK